MSAAKSVVKILDLDSCVVLLRNENAPLSAPEIAKRAWNIKSLSKGRKEEVLSALDQLVQQSKIFEWPAQGARRIFSAQPLRESVAAALLEALDEQPLAPNKAVAPVRKRLRLISARDALEQIKAAAAGLVAANKICTLAVSGRAFVYVSFGWLERLLPQARHDSDDSILNAVRRLESESGNYVRVDHLRKTPETRRLLDDIVVRLADAGKLVLARYDGSRNLPDEERVKYVESPEGDLFIAVASPRAETHGA